MDRASKARCRSTARASSRASPTSSTTPVKFSCAWTTKATRTTSISASSGWSSRAEPPFLLQFDHVRANLNFRRAVQARIEVGVDPRTHLGGRARAGGDGLENLLLALETMGDVFVDERHRVVARGAVRGKDAPRRELAQAAQRSDVVAHVAVGRKNGRRSLSEDRVAGEEIAAGREVADVLVGVAGRGDDAQAVDDVAVADDDVGLVEHAARRDDARAGAAPERKRGRRVIAV